MNHDIPWPETCPAWARRLGFFEWTPKLKRSRWIELSVDRRTMNLVSANLCKFNDHWSFHVAVWPVDLFIRLPFNVKTEPKDCCMDGYGFSIHRDDIHFRWGHRSKIYCLPWNWSSCVKWDVWTSEGWKPYDHRKDLPEDTIVLTEPYRYMLRDSSLQERTATFHATRMEWRWQWLRWLPFPRKVRYSIEVEFDDEVGERAGSWKGGVLGCGYDLHMGETMVECLKRMERDRKFT